MFITFENIVVKYLLIWYFMEQQDRSISFHLSISDMSSVKNE